MHTSNKIYVWHLYAYTTITLYGSYLGHSIKWKSSFASPAQLPKCRYNLIELRRRFYLCSGHCHADNIRLTSSLILLSLSLSSSLLSPSSSELLSWAPSSCLTSLTRVLSMSIVGCDTGDVNVIWRDVHCSVQLNDHLSHCRWFLSPGRNIRQHLIAIYILGLIGLGGTRKLNFSHITVSLGAISTLAKIPIPGIIWQFICDNVYHV